MGEPASDQARRRHAGEFHDAAQLPVVFHRFRAVRRMRNPTQVSAQNTTRCTAVLAACSCVSHAAFVFTLELTLFCLSCVRRTARNFSNTILFGYALLSRPGRLHAVIASSPIP